MSRATASKTMTAEVFVRKYGGEHGVELVNGKLVRLPTTGANHGGVEITVAAMLQEFVRKKKLGRVLGGEVGIHVQRNPDTLRAADVLFLSYAKWPKSKPLPKGPLEVAPELVVEIRSPWDRHKAIREKTEDNLAAGVKVVMLIDPETESIGVFRDEELPMRFHNGDTVTLPDVLPGFAAPVKAFFE